MSHNQDSIELHLRNQPSVQPSEKSRQGARQDDVYGETPRNHEIFRTRNEDKMELIDVFFLIVNRMIGTGIFEQPSTILLGCGSLGASLLLWLLGGLIALSGLMVYIEFGLMVPRDPDRFGRNWICIPRSGGEKNYFEYLFAKLGLLPVCVYGLIFLFLGNPAGNSYIFAQYFLRMVGVEDPTSVCYEKASKGIAIAVITFACFVHSIWRKGGIKLLNILAAIKLLVLWIIIILGFAARAGAFEFAARKGDFEAIKEQNPPAWKNLGPSKLFKEPVPDMTTNLSTWTSAILNVLYAYSGYESANYVLSEIENPVQNLAPATISATGFTSLTYILTIISYYLVIPAGQLLPDNKTGDPARPLLLFFEQLFARHNTNGELEQDEKFRSIQRIVSALVALSSFGNIMTYTFVASRVKQEIAKEGIVTLPPYKFWKGEYDSGWRLIADLFGGSRKAQSNDNTKKDKTPIPALILHWATSLILVLAPPGDLVYELFTSMNSYMFQACFGLILSGGLIYLRYIKPWWDTRFEWVALSKEVINVPWFLRPIFLSLYFIATVFLVIAPFIGHANAGESPGKSGNETTIESLNKPGNETTPDKCPTRYTQLEWFVSPTVCFSLFGGGILFWFILDVLCPLPAFRHRKVFRHRTAVINPEGNLAWEGILIEWRRTDSYEQETSLLAEEDPRLPRDRVPRRENDNA